MRSMIALMIPGAVGKFMSATHMGITSKPGAGASGAKPPGWPIISTAIASRPFLSIMEVKSYFMKTASLICFFSSGNRFDFCYGGRAKRNSPFIFTRISFYKSVHLQVCSSTSLFIYKPVLLPGHEKADDRQNDVEDDRPVGLEPGDQHEDGADPE